MGFRIYRQSGTKEDARGHFDGFSDKFDTWMPAFSARIAKFYTKSDSKGLMSDDIETQDEFDSAIQPEEGFERVYAVPRLRRCQSRALVQLVNTLGNQGTYDLVLKLLSHEELPYEIFAAFMKLVGQCWVIYHKDFINEIAIKFTSIAEKKLKSASDNDLRNVKKERSEAVILSIDNLKKRVMDKDEREF